MLARGVADGIAAEAVEEPYVHTTGRKDSERLAGLLRARSVRTQCQSPQFVVFAARMPSSGFADPRARAPRRAAAEGAWLYAKLRVSQPNHHEFTRGKASCFTPSMPPISIDVVIPDSRR